MTPPHRRRRRPWTVPAAGATLSAVALGLVVTTTYAAPFAGGSPLPRVVGPVAAPAVTPSCQPWQTRQAVPSGVTLTPRVFPTDEPAAPTAPARPTSRPTARPTATTATAPKPPKVRVVCRNAPPTPFAHPAWEPESVVGGSRMAETGVLVDRPASVPAPPEVYDVSYVVADLETGEILAAKSPHAWLRPASTLKTLTALTLMPRLDPRRVVVAGQDAQDAAGSRVGILAGNRYPVSSLFDAMLMFSANDAVYALADAAGGYDATVALMNAKAEQIGAHDTLTVDPSGLDDGAQRSSAYDLALIGRDAMRLPAFRAAITKRDAVFPGGKDKQGKVWPAFHVYNINEPAAALPRRHRHQAGPHRPRPAHVRRGGDPRWAHPRRDADGQHHRLVEADRGPARLGLCQRGPGRTRRAARRARRGGRARPGAGAFPRCPREARPAPAVARAPHPRPGRAPPPRWRPRRPRRRHTTAPCRSWCSPGPASSSPRPSRSSRSHGAGAAQPDAHAPAGADPCTGLATTTKCTKRMSPNGTGSTRAAARRSGLPLAAQRRPIVLAPAQESTS